MRYVRLTILVLVTTSCGAYDSLFTTFVTYNREMQEKHLTMPYFFGFNQAPLDSLLGGINEQASAKYRLVINNQGRFIKSIELKNTFAVDNQKKIRELVQNLDYLPYLENDMATTVFTVKRKKNRVLILDSGLRPKDKDSLKKYGVD